MDETPEQREARIERYATAILYFIEHPDAPLDPVVRAYVDRIKRKVEELEKEEAKVQMTLLQ